MTIDKDLVMKRFKKSIVIWDRFAEEAKGHEKDMVIMGGDGLAEPFTLDIKILEDTEQNTDLEIDRS